MFEWEFTKQNFFGIYRDLPIITLDGAGSRLIDIEVYLDFVVGDMDLFHRKISNYTNIDFIKYNDQNYNDFEKSIFYTRKESFSIISTWNI